MPTKRPLEAEELDRVVYVLTTGDIVLMRVIGVIVLIAVIVCAGMLAWCVVGQDEEGEEE